MHGIRVYVPWKDQGPSKRAPPQHSTRLATLYPSRKILCYLFSSNCAHSLPRKRPLWMESSQPRGVAHRRCAEIWKRTLCGLKLSAPASLRHDCQLEFPGSLLLSNRLKPCKRSLAWIPCFKLKRYLPRSRTWTLIQTSWMLSLRPRRIGTRR